MSEWQISQLLKLVYINFKITKKECWQFVLAQNIFLKNSFKCSYILCKCNNAKHMPQWRIQYTFQFLIAKLSSLFFWYTIKSHIKQQFVYKY